MERSVDNEREGAPVDSSEGLRELGNDIWLSGQSNGSATRLIAGKAYVRFLDRLYLPVDTHLLTQDQVLTINQFRNSIIHSDSQFDYNSKVKSIFRAIVERATGPILEVGPSVDPVIPSGRVDALLCDIDEDVNRKNISRGFRCAHPRDLGVFLNPPFQLIFGCFVFHFGLDLSEATNLANALDPNGAIVFNVVSRSAATRTNAISQLSLVGLRFQSFELGPSLGKNDVVFVGSKYEKSSHFQLEIRETLEKFDIYNGLGNA